MAKAAKKPEEVISDIPKEALDRDYKGRRGWTLGASWDSVKYAARLFWGAVSRRLARRKVVKILDERKELFEQRLVELGRFALYLDGFSHESMSEFNEDLDKLEKRKADLEEEIGEVQKRYQQAKVEGERVRGELEQKYREAKTARRDVEAAVDPLIAELNSHKSKWRRSEYEIEHLEEKVRLGDADLDRLSRENAPVTEVSKLRTKVSRWRGEIKKIERKIPELRSRVQSLKPQIEDLRKDLENSKKEEELAKAEFREAMAQEKTRREEIITEKEGLQHALSEVEKFKRNVFLETGRMLNWNRIEDVALEGRYGELDGLEKERKRLELKVSLLNKPSGKLAWEPLFRAFVIFTCIILVALIVVKVTVL